MYSYYLLYLLINISMTIIDETTAVQSRPNLLIFMIRLSNILCPLAVLNFYRNFLISLNLKSRYVDIGNKVLQILPAMLLNFGTPDTLTCSSRDVTMYDIVATRLIKK